LHPRARSTYRIPRLHRGGESSSVDQLTPSTPGTAAAEYTVVLCLDFPKNYGDLDDYLQEYAEGRLTAEAKAVYEALLEHGPLDTVRLRREAHMSTQSAKSRFERALVELQVGLKVLPVGVAEAGAWRYAFLYELLPRWFPDVPERARAIGRGEARRHILLRYLRNVVAATPAQAARLFGWTTPEVERAAAQLEAAGEVRVEGLRGQQMVIAAVWAGN